VVEKYFSSSHTNGVWLPVNGSEISNTTPTLTAAAPAARSTALHFARQPGWVMSGSKKASANTGP